MRREGAESAVNGALLVGRFLGEVAEEFCAVFRVDAGEPGERDAAGVEATAGTRSLDSDDRAVVEAKQNVYRWVGIDGCVGGVYTVSFAFELKFTAASIVIR